MSLAGLSVCMLVLNEVRHDSRVMKEARSLSEAGAAVTVVGVGEASGGIASGKSVILVPPMKPSQIPLRSLRIVANLIREFRFERRLRQAAVAVPADVYHCHDLNTVAAGMYAARRNESCLVYDSHELFTEARSWKPRQLRRWRRLESHVLMVADLVLAASNERARIMYEEYGAPRLPLTILNVPRTAEHRSEPVPEAAEARSKLGARRLLIYQGSLSEARALDKVVAALHHLPEDYHLVLMGPGRPGRKLTEALEITAGRSHVWPAVPPDEVIGWAAVADAGVVSYPPTNRNNLFCAPNKAFDYLAAGLPLLAARLPGLDWVGQQHVGVQFEPGDAADLAHKALELLEDDERQEEASFRSRTLASQVTWGQQAEKLVNAYLNMFPCGEKSRSHGVQPGE